MPKIAVITAGGDAPGLNAVIRALVKRANDKETQVLGFRDGFVGLMSALKEPRYQVPLVGREVSGILHRGGTILGTARGGPFDGGQDRSAEVAEVLKKCEVECLVVIGGDGSLTVADMLYQRGIPTVGVPKTIDNDLSATDQTFGFDTAVNTATEALDRLHTTAEAHHRVMIMEVMGREAGWIALHSGIAGGADVILIPEIKWTLKGVYKKIEERRNAGKTFSIIVLAEGVKDPDNPLPDSHPRKPWLGARALKERLEILSEASGRKIEVRDLVLGHLQRGGSPTPFDRILATRYGVGAANLALDGKYGQMVALKNGKITSVPLVDAKQRKTVPTDHDLVKVARRIGITLGDGK